MTSSDTIYALSSGGLPSGVAVVRLSGPKSLKMLTALTTDIPEPRKLALREITDPRSGKLLDLGMVCWFQGPASFTGEDVVEIHLHGGLAVISGVFEAISSYDGLRLAEAGEFSKRAFDNGKIDLTEAEGLADLLAAETALQREMAIEQAKGGLRCQLEGWRSEIVRMRAFIEAEFDFSDEEDVPDSMLDEVTESASRLVFEIEESLAAGGVGEMLRSGYRVALMGPPNAGKSSLLNALAKRDVAIVSDIPGTTRDLIDVRLDIDGVPVIVTDTAGIRKSSDEIEALGVERALGFADEVDVVVWMSPADEPLGLPSLLEGLGTKVLPVVSKLDLVPLGKRGGCLGVYSSSEEGLSDFLEVLRDQIGGLISGSNNAMLNRERHRTEVSYCLAEMKLGLSVIRTDMTLASEHFRRAGDHIGRLTGVVDVEDLLDVIFSEFCVGK